MVSHAEEIVYPYFLLLSMFSLLLTVVSYLIPEWLFFFFFLEYEPVIFYLRFLYMISIMFSDVSIAYIFFQKRFL